MTQVIVEKHPLVGDKTSIDVIGLFVAIIRERFAFNGAEFPWKWDSNETLSKIFIDAGGVDTYGNNDARPGIFIDRSSIVYSKVAVNNMADYNLRNSDRTYVCKATGSVAIDCVSKNRGESSILGDLCATHLVMSDDLFRRVYNFQDIGPVSLGNTQPWEKDDRVFVSRVECEFTHDVFWTYAPASVRIERINGIILPQLN